MASEKTTDAVALNIDPEQQPEDTTNNDDDEATFKALVLLRKFSANPDESLLPRILEIMVDNPTCLQLVTNCLENKNTHMMRVL